MGLNTVAVGHIVVVVGQLIVVDHVILLPLYL